MALMGQDLFNPPNVGGWPGGFTWVTASALVERFNFAGLLTARYGTGIATGGSGPLQGNGAMPTTGVAPGNSLNPQQLVMQSGARDTSGLVDYLLTRFIGVGATPATRAGLLAYMGGNGALSTQAVETKVRGLIQLVLATPEYQLN
jgi:hypothetical protein